MIAPLLAVPLGLLVGVTLGAVGGGGSILTVPALIYALGEDPRNATTGSLVIVGLTAVTETMGHARAGRVRWVPGLVFGVIGVGGSVIGSRLNKLVEPNVLLLASQPQQCSGGRHNGVQCPLLLVRPPDAG